MRRIELLALLLKYKVSLKYLKRQLSPTFWELFKKAVNDNDIKRAEFYLNYFLKSA